MPVEIESARQAMGAAWVDVCAAWDELQACPKTRDARCEPYRIWSAAVAVWAATFRVFLDAMPAVSDRTKQEAVVALADDQAG
jgi:hypothetical protein